MKVDEAIYGAENPITMSYSKAETALLVLAAEVRRLRAAVEAVRALPRWSTLSDGDWRESGETLEAGADGPLLMRDDVLAALEVNDAA